VVQATQVPVVVLQIGVLGVLAQLLLVVQPEDVVLQEPEMQDMPAGH
jgi:hypothetical protein